MSCLIKLRLSSHNLSIETGRYCKTPRNERFCSFCQTHEIEDEFHHILICPFLNDIRLKYIKAYYRINPNILKFFQLLSSDNVTELRNLGKFLYCAEKRRKLHI